jgi:predicted anti-sigma-YlaC factor YlaD
MTCTEIQDLFGVYFDLPEEDPRRADVDAHIAVCESCREEFLIWEESTDLIRMAKDDTVPHLYAAPPITDNVMKRIYQDESWRLPVSNRIYSIPFKLRRNMTAVIAFFLALFIVSFLYSAMDGPVTIAGDTTGSYGVVQAAKASANAADSLNVHKMVGTTLASASPTMIDPVKIGPIKTVPDYFLSLSILGLISTLLIMNWLSRTRS